MQIFYQLRGKIFRSAYQTVAFHKAFRWNALKSIYIILPTKRPEGTACGVVEYRAHVARSVGTFRADTT